MNNITVKIKCFSLVKRQTGQAELSMALPENTTNIEFLNKFLNAYPGLNGIPIRIAVNREYSEDTVKLNDGDEIALIPPVSGG